MRSRDHEGRATTSATPARDGGGECTAATRRPGARRRAGSAVSMVARVEHVGAAQRPRAASAGPRRPGSRRAAAGAGRELPRDPPGRGASAGGGTSSAGAGASVRARRTERRHQHVARRSAGGGPAATFVMACGHDERPVAGQPRNGARRGARPSAASPATDARAWASSAPAGAGRTGPRCTSEYTATATPPATAPTSAAAHRGQPAAAQGEHQPQRSEREPARVVGELTWYGVTSTPRAARAGARSRAAGARSRRARVPDARAPRGPAQPDLVRRAAARVSKRHRRASACSRTPPARQESVLAPGPRRRPGVALVGESVSPPPGERPPSARTRSARRARRRHARPAMAGPTGGPTSRPCRL